MCVRPPNDNQTCTRFLCSDTKTHGTELNSCVRLQITVHLYRVQLYMYACTVTAVHVRI